MKSHSEINRLIRCVSTSVDLLEPAAYDEVCDFIRQSQTLSGAFTDRGGQPDWYYSLFGFLISKAFNLKPELSRLRRFVLNSNKMDEQNFIEWSVWVLLRYSFKPGFIFKLRISLRLAQRWITNRQKDDQVYLTFLSLLILNHFWGWSRCISNQIDRLTSAFILNDHSPTSHLAAALCIRNHANLNTDDLSAMLMKNAHPEGGFVSFGDHGTADMLSTAVAVYALNQAGTNIGAMKPDGLEFVSSHFDNGAFLSGDGDPTRDVEYTFYGLLALSSYAQLSKE
jgi:hypothetical protein